VLVTSVGNEPVTAVGFSADGWFVFVATNTNRLVKVTADGTTADMLRSGAGVNALRGFTIDPLGQILYVVTSSLIVPVPTGLPDPSFAVIAPPNGNGLTCAVVVGPKLLAIGSGFGVDRPVAGYFRLLTLPVGTERGPAVTEKGGVIAIANHEPSNTVAWATGTREVVVWDMAKPDRVRISFQHPAGAIAFTSDGTMIAMAMQWNVALWDWKKKQERAVL
jgi:DNA-binding beta-propeller fold protein YncE